MVHKKFICAKSEYFTKAFRENAFKESGKRTIYLRENFLSAVTYFIRQLYIDGLPEIFPYNGQYKEGYPNKRIHVDKVTTQLRAYGKLHIFADKILLEIFKIAAMDKFKKLSSYNCNFFGMIPWIYENTNSDFLLKRFLVRWTR